MSDRDRMLLEKILVYCSQIEDFKKQYGGKEALSQNISYQYCCTVCLMQIGELSSRLTEGAKLTMDMISWPKLKGLRNMLVHEYGHITWETIWKTIHSDIPILKIACRHYLESL